MKSCGRACLQACWYDAEMRGHTGVGSCSCSRIASGTGADITVVLVCPSFLFLSCMFGVPSLPLSFAVAVLQPRHSVCRVRNRQEDACR